ncbi:hypothetical protein ACJX0J_025878 [Zea mays]
MRKSLKYGKIRLVSTHDTLYLWLEGWIIYKIAISLNSLLAYERYSIRTKKVQQVQLLVACQQLTSLFITMWAFDVICEIEIRFDRTLLSFFSCYMLTIFFHLFVN